MAFLGKSPPTCRRLLLFVSGGVESRLDLRVLAQQLRRIALQPFPPVFELIQASAAVFLEFLGALAPRPQLAKLFAETPEFMFAAEHAA